MTYRVVAGYVTVQTRVGPGRAYIDIRRGELLPSDVPAADVEWLLRSGQIEEAAADDGDALDGLSKDELVRLAADEGIDIDKRWGATRIVDAIRRTRQ